MEVIIESIKYRAIGRRKAKIEDGIIKFPKRAAEDFARVFFNSLTRLSQNRAGEKATINIRIAEGTILIKDYTLNQKELAGLLIKGIMIE